MMMDNDEDNVIQCHATVVLLNLQSFEYIFPVISIPVFFFMIAKTEIIRIVWVIFNIHVIKGPNVRPYNKSLM